VCGCCDAIETFSCMLVYSASTLLSIFQIKDKHTDLQVSFVAQRYCSCAIV